MSEQVYCVHAGEVRSKYDKDVHWISARRLMELYNVNPERCRIFHENMGHRGLPVDVICLYPSYDGIYRLNP